MKFADANGVTASSSSFLLSSRRWRCLWWQSRPCCFLIVAYLVLCFPIMVKSRLCLDDDHVYSDFGSSVYGRQSFKDDYGPRDACSFPNSFLFQSTLNDFLAEEDDCEASKRFGQSSMFKDIVSPSLRNSVIESISVPVERVDFCEDSLFFDLWMKASTSFISDFGEDVILINSSPLPEIQIIPTILDWGTKNIYSPSLQMLKVVNKHNESVLKVNNLFSTNTQFSAYNFQEILLSPGESTSIPLIFLPACLGFSSGQLLLQTSFGGFVIQVEGMAAKPPYKIQPLVGFNTSNDEGFKRKLSLYNPSNDFLQVKEVSVCTSISASKKNHSVHALCDTNRFHQYNIQSVSHIDSELGSSRLDIRALRQWEVAQNSSRTNIELNLWPRSGEKVSGAFCIKLSISSQEKFDGIILSIDTEMRERESYPESKENDFVSAYFKSLIVCDEKKMIFSISLRNDDASYLLSFEKIGEDTKACKYFEIDLKSCKYFFESQDRVDKNHGLDLNHMLIISTNLMMSIPRRIDLQTCELKGLYIKLIFEHEDENHASTRIESMGNACEQSSEFKPKFTALIEYDDSALKNQKSQATMNHYSQLISVRNPCRKQAFSQPMLDSVTIIVHCKFTDEISDHTFSTRFSHLDSPQILVGFSIPESAVAEAFAHSLGSDLFGPAKFHPSNRCAWRISAVLMNNSDVEWLSLQAFVDSQLLVIFEEFVPVLKMDLNLQSSTAFDASSSDTFISIKKQTSFRCNPFTKEVFAKNTSELSIEMMKQIVSGTVCVTNGFTVDNCEGFVLAPGESTTLLISFRADFSAGIVHSDLELDLDAGIFVIPMKVTVSVNVLAMCRKALCRSMHWKLFVLVLFAFFVALRFMLGVIDQAFPASNEDCFYKFSIEVESICKTEASSSLRQNARNSRFSKDDSKIEATNHFNQHPNCTSDQHHVHATKKQVKGCLDHRKTVNLSPQSGNCQVEVPGNTRVSEMAQNCNLTIRVARDKGRRRKRRSSGVGLTAKVDVSSSQSGNSTPSSPLSPSTPKHSIIQSPETPEESKEHTRHGFKASYREIKAESAKCHHCKEPSSDRGLPSLGTKFNGNPCLSLSATFPGPGWHAPGTSASSFLASTSRIAPCSRAPGSKLRKEKTVEGELREPIEKDFTYDIWGNHLSENLFGETKANMTKSLDASSDSHSFFTRDPQSPMMMSLARSVSPGLEFPF